MGERGPLLAVQKVGGVVVCDRCRLADRPLARMRGLLGRRDLPAGEGILLRPERSIHTWFMRFPIDVVFLDADLTVVGVREDVRPWRMVGSRRAKSVLELRAGTCRRYDIRDGDRLSLIDAGSECAEVLLLVEDGASGRVVVNGHGSLSAIARTADAIGDLNIPISVVVLPGDTRSADSSL